MDQPDFTFDHAVVEDAVARIQDAASYIGSLRGFLPADLKGLSLLRCQVEELRTGLIVLSALADTLQHLHERTARSEAPAWAYRSAPRHKPG